MALAGNANGGKNVRFNQLMCSNQLVGNWHRKNPFDGSIAAKIGSVAHALSRAVASIIQVKQTK
jgi:hypothetical protein